MVTRYKLAGREKKFMSTTTASTNPAPQKKRSIGKIIGVVLSIPILLVVIGYFVATSSAFFKGVILPQVGKAMNADLTVADASISPFSQVVLTKLEVKPHGKETLLKADEAGRFGRRRRDRHQRQIRLRIRVNELAVRHGDVA